MHRPNVHRAVLEAGEKQTGVSVHRVDEDYDTSRAIAQRTVPVEPGNTPESLAERVREKKRAFLVEAPDTIENGRITLA